MAEDSIARRASGRAPRAGAASVARILALSIGWTATAALWVPLDASELPMAGAADCFALYGNPNSPGVMFGGRGNGNGNGNTGNGNGNGNSGNGNGNGNSGNNNGNWNTANCVGNFYRSDGNDNGVVWRPLRPRYRQFPQK